MHLFYKLATAATVTLALAGARGVMAAETVPQAAATAAPPAAESSATSGDPADVVVTINGVGMTRAELDRNVGALLAQSRSAAPLDPAMRERIEETARENMIRSELLYQLAKDETVADLDEQTDAQLAEIRSRFASEEEWETTLAQKGVTPDALREILKQGILIDAFIENEVASKIEITDAQLKAFYDENADAFKKPESIRASHILIGVDSNATPEEKEKAKQKAEGLLKQVQSGEDFAELAKTESTCPSAPQGGDLGEFGRGQMVAPFEEAAFSLEPGDVSEVVETQFGYHIIKSTGKNAAGAVPFEDMKAQIEKQLRAQELQMQVLAKVDAFRQTSVITFPEQVQ
ncbi:peptidylprolyl isomerase [Thiocapsa marina]|uniref:peptidylprolyl isomerase n=1 Tax=Thiocapsa marina 5811 TaxID=768671 RepID=F9UHI3_9GAMM|nr:peptidylprolyl isomerase [Thiocapsa marina]EGV16292.1 PpiC-type peptidyl-prolyl cis-trans isomerase [Thiocapsa marina 5811]